MITEVYGFSDIGRVRDLNEDSFCIHGFEHGKPPGFCILSDGMGGHNAGEVASQKTVQLSSEYILREMDFGKRFSPPKALNRAVRQTNQIIFEMAEENPAQRGMGATMVAAYIDTGGAYIANVGDSRAYACRNGELLRITKDHSIVEELVDSGTITREEARNHPRKNIITRAIGSSTVTEADIFEYDYLPGDMLLLCSDGLSGMLTEEEMLSYLTADNSVEEITRQLIDAANARGGEDNITVVCIRFLQED